MNIRPFAIKARLKSKEIARRFRRPTRVESLESFLSRHWNGPIPNCSYFADSDRFFFSPKDASEYRKALNSYFPDSASETISRTDKTLAHTFNMLGSGEINLGGKIDWSRDFKSGRQWEKKPHGRIRLVYPDDNSDVKIPWELSRLQFLTDLGRAYFLAGNDSYKREFTAILRDWEAENPVGIGVNWTCSMEVAIRAANIIWGIHYFTFAESENELIHRIIRLLYYHALHIEQNLEIISAGANSNHLISDYLGLFYIGLIIPEFDRSAKWVGIGLDGLENEIIAQVMPDGPDYEGSTSYHRLVLEIFLTAFALGKRNGISFSDSYRDRLAQMIEFSEAVTGNSGLAPLIGDNDDGFIIKLASENPSDHKPLIDIGRVLLGEQDSKGIAPTEERLWYLGPNSLSRKSLHAKSISKLFPKSGYAVIRNEKIHLLFNAFPVPERNFGGHKHNDLLALTLEVDSLPYLIDPGTFCYSSDYDMRNRSRSTALHSTFEIDSCEQSRFLPGKLFFLMRDAEAKIDFWEENAGRVTVSGHHTGYGRLGDSITHRRTITVFITEPSVVVTDEFTGRCGIVHEFAGRLIMPDIQIEKANDREFAIRHQEHPGLIIKSSAQGFRNATSNELEYFPRYGVRRRGFCLEFNYRARLPFVATTAITLNSQAGTERPNRIESADTKVAV
jgi:hypothetical protein